MKIFTIKNKWIRGLIAAVFWLGVWQLIYLAVDYKMLLPSPAAVAARLFQLAGTADFWLSVAVSLIRILGGFIAGTLIGVLLAAVTLSSALCETIIKPVVTMLRTVPVASFILLALLWIDKNLLPVFTAVIMTVPLVWGSVNAGYKNIDRGRLEFAAVYGFSFSKKLIKLYIPSILPYFSSSVITGMGLAWKAGVAAEVLAVPVMAIGTRLRDAKMYIETPDVFAWTAVIIALSVLLERLIKLSLGRLEKKYKNYAHLRSA